MYVLFCFVLFFACEVPRILALGPEIQLAPLQWKAKTSCKSIHVWCKQSLQIINAAANWSIFLCLYLPVVVIFSHLRKLIKVQSSGESSYTIFYLLTNHIILSGRKKKQWTKCCLTEAFAPVLLCWSQLCHDPVSINYAWKIKCGHKNRLCLYDSLCVFICIICICSCWLGQNG